MEEFDIKKIAIAVIVAIIIILGIIFAIFGFSKKDKIYTLEQIAEEEIKYFAVNTNRKIRSNKRQRRHNSRKQIRRCNNSKP